MSQSMHPFLAAFAVPPLAAPENRLPFAIGDDGLAYRAGATVPLIDEIKISSCDGPTTPNNYVATTLTEQRQDDPDDPDRVRNSLLTHTLYTVVTRADRDPEDPDRVRDGIIASLATLVTKADNDPSDPDRVRR